MTALQVRWGLLLRKNAHSKTAQNGQCAHAKPDVPKSVEQPLNQLATNESPQTERARYKCSIKSTVEPE